MQKISLYFAVGLLLSTAIFAQTNQPLPPLWKVPDMNGMAISLIKPDFPENAVVAQADGLGVNVMVIVDESGSVLSAKCSQDCHPMLRDAAELAAASSKFRSLKDRDGQAIKYAGLLQYTFVVERIDWYRFGTSFESVRQFDNISLGPAAQILSKKFPAEREKLFALDTKGTPIETRWKVMHEVEDSLRAQIKGGDLWRFEIGMGLRLITFWTVAAEATNRGDLQAAIDRLSNIISTAPTDIPPATIEALSALSKFRVPADLPERELRQEISKLTRGIRIQ